MSGISGHDLPDFDNLSYDRRDADLPAAPKQQQSEQPEAAYSSGFSSPKQATGARTAKELFKNISKQFVVVGKGKDKHLEVAKEPSGILERIKKAMSSSKPADRLERFAEKNNLNYLEFAAHIDTLNAMLHLLVEDGDSSRAAACLQNKDITHPQIILRAIPEKLLTPTFIQNAQTAIKANYDKFPQNHPILLLSAAADQQLALQELLKEVTDAASLGHALSGFSNETIGHIFDTLEPKQQKEIAAHLLNTQGDAFWKNAPLNLQKAARASRFQSAKPIKPAMLTRATEKKQAPKHSIEPLVVRVEEVSVAVTRAPRKVKVPPPPPPRPKAQSNLTPELTVASKTVASVRKVALPPPRKASPKSRAPALSVVAEGNEPPPPPPVSRKVAQVAQQIAPPKKAPPPLPPPRTRAAAQAAAPLAAPNPLASRKQVFMSGVYASSALGNLEKFPIDHQTLRAAKINFNQSRSLQANIIRGLNLQPLALLYLILDTEAANKIKENVIAKFEAATPTAQRALLRDLENPKNFTNAGKGVAFTENRLEALRNLLRAHFKL